MLNVMEAGHPGSRLPPRLPLDVLVVASASPEDYTNRGRIIARSGPVRRRDPHALSARTRCRVGVIRQSPPVAEVPSICFHIISRFARLLRRVQLGRPALRRVCALRHRRRGNGGCVGPGTAAPFSANRTRWPAWSTSGTIVDVLRGKLEFRIR